MIKDPIATMISDVKLMLEEMDYPPPYVVARELDIPVFSGPIAAFTFGPPPSISLPDNLRGFYRSYTLAHEIAHALMQWRGIDAELLAYYAPECAHSNQEALANHVAGLMCVPKPFFDSTLKRNGFSPTAMIHLSQSLGAPLETVMARTVYEDESYHRAALFFKRGYVHSFASTFWLEVQYYDYIAEPKKRFPGILLKPLPSMPGHVLGTLVG